MIKSIFWNVVAREQLKSSLFLENLHENLSSVGIVRNPKEHDELCTSSTKSCSDIVSVDQHVDRIPHNAQFNPQTAAPPVQDLVCYGVGQFASDLIARYQLCLLLILKEDFEITEEHCFVFDPMLSKTENDILSELGCTVIPINEEGKRVARARTLFFMPHCGKALYNNLLWANWHPDKLKNIVLLGNSFSHMQLSTPCRILEDEGAYIVKVLPFLKEYNIRNNFIHKDIFNDLSLMMPDLYKLHLLDTQLWLDNPEPVYRCASDIIVNK